MFEQQMTVKVDLATLLVLYRDITTCRCPLEVRQIYLTKTIKEILLSAIQDMGENFQRQGCVFIFCRVLCLARQEEIVLQKYRLSPLPRFM